MSRSPSLRGAVFACALSGAVGTIVLSLSPAVPFAFRSPETHLFLEAAAGFVAALVAYITLGRFRLSALIGDLALFAALATFAAANILFAALPAVVAQGTPGAFSTWAALSTRLLGAGLLAYAAFAPKRTVRLRKRAAATLALGHLVAIAVIALVVALVRSKLPLGIDPGLSPGAAARAHLTAHPGVQAVQLVAFALLAMAALGFLRRSEREGDELAAWLAAGSALAAFSRVDYALFPSLFSDWVYVGDLLRLTSYVVLLIGAAREIGSYWRSVAAAAAFDERRRIARNLHDGLAQELAFIASQSRRLLVRGHAVSELSYISTAAERALDESRRAIATLTRPPDEPLAHALAEVAEDVGARAGLRLEFELEEHIVVAPGTREALVRIVREAVTNAAHHGQATRARITLSNGHGVRLQIRDDGAGFDREAVRSGGGFGLTSMEERAREIGGTLQISSGPNRGTEIEVTVR